MRSGCDQEQDDQTIIGIWAKWICRLMENVNTCGKQLINPNVLHIQYKFKNNRAENSYQLTRERERRMRGFKPAGLAQRFLANFGAISSFFKVGRHLRAA